MPPPLPPWDGFGSGKKTLKSKGASAPAASAIPASNEPRPARPGTARPGPQVPPNGLLQPGRPSLGGGGDFYDVAFKVMLVGDSGVGKTCLLVRFKDGAFLAGTFISTVGIDFRNKVLDVDGMKVKLQIWDTAGQERFRSVTHAYYRDAHALLLLYDVTNKASFDNIQAWLTEIQEYAQHDVVLMLLGNKVDSTQERVVKREDGEKLAKEYGLPFMETSAKTGLNVDLAFTAIAKELKQRSMKAPSEPRFQLHDYVKREGRVSSCCRP
ncbi:ras-related protein Rab-26 isoform X7 [Pteropus alecto]|uniref:small monomeric GTPase n=1 Tax=Pteropus vampyrus TaxID=132908 RepID=A0A6P3RD01_PTEVA|nr:ras-related protein Rab-26 isoform X3 [Pteropus vampyrus]XP_015446478.2 ras-related protein Rab-26 isoform X7 [Pteropus alecto]XP_039740939.1 ras-related protein Rab-26 isoform X9 [Pteropus giganteus]